jgi:hypothetical protein
MNARAQQPQNPPSAPENQTRLEPERLGDVEQGAEAPDAEVDELGLTPTEREAWDAMEADAKAAPQPVGEPEEVDAPAEGDDVDPAAPKPPVTAEDDDEDDAPAAPQKGKGNTVSRHKYQRDVTKREQEAAILRQQLEQERIDRAKLSERLTILNEALMTPAPQDPAKVAEQAAADNPWLEKTISVEEDAIGAIAQMQRRQEYNNRVQADTVETIQARDEDSALKQSFDQDIKRYTAQAPEQNPDAPHFMDAYGYIKNSRLTEIAISLFDKDPNDPNEVFTQQEISQIISDFNAEEKWVVSNAVSKNKSPAAAIVRMAKARGWKPAPPAGAPAPQPGVRQPAAGAAPRAAAPRAPAAPAAPSPTAVDRLNSEIAGAAAAKSLSDGGGAPPLEPLDAARLLKMSDEEFGEYIDRMPKGRLDSLMGKEPERAQY